MMVFIAKKLLLDSEITSLEFIIFKDQCNAQVRGSESSGDRSSGSNVNVNVNVNCLITHFENLIWTRVFM